MPNLFGTDGIRGSVGKDPLTPDFFVKIGKSAGIVLSEGRQNISIIVGRDTRQSGLSLQNALVSGLTSSGINVIDVGIATTPMVSWLVSNFNYSGGAVISASHNPVEQNGVKFFNPYGDKLSEFQEQQIEEIIYQASLNMQQNHQHAGSTIESYSLSKHYVDAQISEHPEKYLSGLRILVDCSNGSASYIAPKIFDQSGAEVIDIHSNPTGENINVQCGSEYIRRNPQKFADYIRENKADIGLGFDGDADRVVFVSREGSLIDGDHMIGILAEFFQNRGELLKETVVTTNMRNQGLIQFLNSRNIKILETPVGDKYVSQELRKLVQEQPHEPEKLGIGGEQAGHILLMDNKFKTGDGIRTALFMLRAFMDSGEKEFDKFSKKINKTPQVIASAFVGDGPKFEENELDQLESTYLNAHHGLIRIKLRYSGTEPIFRIMLEGKQELNELDLARLSKELSLKAQQKSGILGGSVDILNCSKGGTMRL